MKHELKHGMYNHCIIKQSADFSYFDNFLIFCNIIFQGIQNVASYSVFVCGYSAFAGMTIPYPKREFLNDDDSDSKSSAAKVISILGHFAL